MKKAQVPSWVWMALTVGHLMAFVWAVQTGCWNFPDSGRYLQAANNLHAHGELYSRPWPPASRHGQELQEFTIRPIGYPAIVLALHGEGGSTVALLFVQDLLSLLNLAVVLRWWSRRSRPTNWQWGGALVLVVSFPGQLVYANAVMSEMALQTVLLQMMWFGVLTVGFKQTRYFIGSCAALVAALLIKPVFYPMAVGMAMVGVGLAWQWKRPWWALVGLSPVLVVGAYMHWNEQRTGYFHFSSIAEINLLHYNAAGVVRQTDGAATEEHWVGEVLQQANRQPTFARRQKFIQTQAVAVVRQHPVVYARQHVQGMVACFLDPGRFDICQFLQLAPPAKGGLLTQSRAGGLVQALGQLPKGLLLLLGLIGMANTCRLLLAVRGFARLKNGAAASRHGRWLAVGLIGYVVLLTGPLGAARFLVPVWPLLLALALVGFAPPAPAGLLGAEERAPMRKD